MITLTTTTGRPEKLADEILAAFPVLAADLRLEYRGSVIVTSLPDDADVAGVQAVIAAHNPNTPSAAELATTERTAATTDLRGQASDALTRLDAIIAAESTMTTNQLRIAVVDIARMTRRLVRERAAALT